MARHWGGSGCGLLCVPFLGPPIRGWLRGSVVCAGGWLGSWISSPFGPGLPRTSTPFEFCAQIAARVQMGYPALHCIASENGIALGEEWVTPPSNCTACKLKENLEIPGTSSGHLCGPSPLVVTGLLADCVSRSQISVSQLWTCVSIQHYPTTMNISTRNSVASQHVG